MADKLIEDLIRDEGHTLTPYKDSVGLWTIGVGHLLGTTPRMTSITERESRALLESDIREAMSRVVKFVPMIHADEYTPEYSVRFRALTNMAFNLGDRLGTFQKFLEAVNAKDWVTASTEMMDSLWAKQVGARAARLSTMILTGREPA
jgi:lysozyme